MVLLLGSAGGLDVRPIDVKLFDVTPIDVGLGEVVLGTQNPV